MARVKKSPANVSATGQLVEALVDVLVHTGADLKEAQLLMRRAQQAVTKKSRRTDPSHAAVDHLAQALFRWYTDPNFVNQRGQPKPLTLKGKNNSLQALIRATRHGPCTSRDLTLLSQNASVRHQDRTHYVPIAQFVDLNGYRVFLLQYACLSAARLLRTALKNSTRKPTEPTLIERLAYVPNLPANQVKSFQQFANAQGAELLKAVNRWLEARQGIPPRGKQAKSTVMAGVHVFGFTENVASRSGHSRTKPC
jgi:hypothetical protein